MTPDHESDQTPQASATLVTPGKGTSLAPEINLAARRTVPSRLATLGEQQFAALPTYEVGAATPAEDWRWSDDALRGAIVTRTAWESGTRRARREACQEQRPPARTWERLLLALAEKRGWVR